MDLIVVDVPGVSAYYTINKKVNGRIAKSITFKNLIIPAILNKIGTGELVSSLAIGSGSTDPTRDDIGLETPISGDYPVEFINVESDTDDAKVFTTFKYKAVIPTGIEITDITEMGIYTAEGDLFSRALLRDEDGYTITASKMEDEEFEIFYTVTFESIRSTNNIQTLIVNDEEVIVSLFTSTNISNMGRFDSANIIKGIFISNAETTSLTDSISPVNLTMPQVKLNWNGSVTIKADLEYSANSTITELVVASTIGWVKYTLSKPIIISAGNKLSLTLGFTYSGNQNLNDIPRDWIYNNAEEIITTHQSIAIVDYNLGVTP